jgi:hypothetical protein
MMQHVAGVVLRTGVVPFSSSSCFLLSSSPSSFFLLCSCFAGGENGGEGENVRVNGERERGLLVVICVMEC